MHKSSPDATPAAPSPAWPRPGGGAATVAPIGGARFDWLTLIPLLLHPYKVAILEAIAWADEPLSASGLAKLFAANNSNLSHHLRRLAKAGVIELKREEERGSVARFYGLPEHLSAEALRRNALYDQIFGYLQELDQVATSIRHRDYEAAKRSSERVSVELRQLLDELGLGERQWQADS